MAVNIAQKRERKAQKRKQILAARRTAEAFEASLAGRVRRAAGTPIQHCLLTESLFEDGIGTLVLARGPTPSGIALGAFLLDTFCLGVKDVIFRAVGSEELATYVEAMEAAAPIAAIEPSHARKLLRDLAAWAQSIGFPPHRDFAVVEQMFGDVSPDACDVTYRFGHDGKPLYMPGPSESPTLVRRHVEQMRKVLGDDGFELEALI